jgi:cytochrome c peroxidase
MLNVHVSKLLQMTLCASLYGACSSPQVAPVSEESEVCSVDEPPATCAALQALRQSETLAPPRDDNPYVDDFNATLLGFRVFFDARFSRDNSVRCESCHRVEYHFSDRNPTPVAGLGAGVRNSPSLFNAARYERLMWDGRAESLAAQPLLAFENPIEMDFTRLEIAHRLQELYSREYEKAFGPMADVSDTTRFPPRGKPGDAAFDGMAEADRVIIQQVNDNLGKALEAYMRKLATGPSPVDRYLAGDAKAIDERAQRGMLLFANTGCLGCHGGPALTDQGFHDIGVGSAGDAAPDMGRGDGRFRTPSLRNLEKTAPYFHDGSAKTLEDAIMHHFEVADAQARDPLLVLSPLSDGDIEALVAFLRALTGAYPALPWSQWPNGNG